MKPYQQTAEEVTTALRTSPQGLSDAEVLARRAKHGPNELAEAEKRSLIRLFLGQFKDFMILVLMAAAVVSGIIGEPSDTLAILVILVLNAVLGFTQEYRAEKAMAALKRMSAVSATVIRGGAQRTVPASELVPGDLVVLEAGNVVPADLRLIESSRLKADEAALTGESVPTEKQTEALGADDLPLGDRTNTLYKGTFVTYGRGLGAVTATGMATELGKIAAMLQTGGQERTPLQKRLARFGKWISVAVLVICAAVFLGGLLRGEAAVRVFLVAVSLAVAAIPEALPAVVTISLAIGARKMAKQNALVRKLPAVETLGSVTYICTDKTGTLTLNRMTVEEIWVDGRTLKRQMTAEDIQGAPALFLKALALSNDARTDASGAVVGDPTEAALYVFSLLHGFDKASLELRHPRMAELPFDSERKLMTTFHRDPGEAPEIAGTGDGGRYLSFTKGAAEVLLSRSESQRGSGERKGADLGGLEAEVERMASQGLRVMGIGMRVWEELPEDLSPQNVETGLVLLGLVGMLDPPRENARDAVTLCRSAGITPVMITGDHPLTAKAIAERVGILGPDETRAILTGAELDGLSLERFEERVESVRVYARVAPEQKLKIVTALQDKGHFVAMTGDGVNDAPALKRADIGVAMGVTGTDVAKEASSMVLLDDNFGTIVKAVREGRRIYDNIRKFIRYLLTTNSGEIWTLFLAPFLGLPIPLQPIHILWINLVTDGLPALALAAEPGERDLMSRPPRPPNQSIFASGLGLHAIWVGLLMAAVVLSLQAWSIHVQDAHWQTMVFTALCFLQLGHALAIRSEKESLFRQGLLSNKPMLASIGATVLLQLATVYVPALHPVFKTEALTLAELSLVLALSTVVFFAVEAEKYFRRRPGESCGGGPPTPNVLLTGGLPRR